MSVSLNVLFASQNFLKGDQLWFEEEYFQARFELISIDNGALTAQSYIEEELLKSVIPFIGDLFILMQDYACTHLPPHTCSKWESVLDWSVQSPYMNPIEHLWDYLGCVLDIIHYPPNSDLSQLQIALREEWNAVPLECIQIVIHSMPDRIRGLRCVLRGMD